MTANPSPARPAAPRLSRAARGVAPLFGNTHRAVLAAAVAAGIAAFAVALARGEAARAWQAYLVNLLFFLGIAQGGVVVAAAFYLTQARWAGTAAFRLAEAFSGFLPLGFVLFWGLYFGRTLIFPWVLHPVAQKAAWLNTPFLFARDGAGLLAMTLLSAWLVRVSRSSQARAWAAASSDIEMPPPAIRRLATVLALAFAAVYSLIAFDLVMSLAPAWHSTLFGAYFFAAAFLSAVAAMALTAVILRGRLGPANAFAAPKVLHDLGKLVFAFSVFWIYLLFAQYIVIWYGDIPVETFFIVQRVYYAPWAPLSYAAVILIWVAPFLVLLGARPKRTPVILGAVAAGVLAGIWLERYVLVVPSLSQHAVPFGWIELLITLGFLGGFVLCAIPGLNLAASAARAELAAETH
ncbi:MAG TPA: hypothetical protein VEC38_14190 [Candidatus Binataceae bacterium]|nr:hypothetical protein [Candidatus Binataceae bacterium]